jgi:hypothetical protein
MYRIIEMVEFSGYYKLLEVGLSLGLFQDQADSSEVEVGNPSSGISAG